MKQIGTYGVFDMENGVVTNKAISAAVNEQLYRFFAIEGASVDNFEVVIKIQQEVNPNDPLGKKFPDDNKFTVGVKGAVKN